MHVCIGEEFAERFPMHQSPSNPLAPRADISLAESATTGVLKMRSAHASIAALCGI